MTNILQDLRYGFRQLRAETGFFLVAILTLALGIGGNTAVFSLVDGILLRPLPYSHPEELVSVTGTYPRGAFSALREQVRTLEVATYTEGHEFNLAGAGEAVRLAGSHVSAEMFSVLGSRAELGRTFLPGEDLPGNDNLVVLSNQLWEQRFGRDPGIVGRSIELEGVNRQVIGVMPAEFRFPSAKTLFWIPLHVDPREDATYWRGDYMPVIGVCARASRCSRRRRRFVCFSRAWARFFPGGCRQPGTQTSM